MEHLDEKELLRRKEIIEWQLTFAKCYKVIASKEERLKEINKQLEKYQK